MKAETSGPAGASAADAAAIRECVVRAEALLRANTTPAGVLAAGRSARAEGRGYTRVFGRDAAICAIAMAASADPVLREGAWRSLETLAAHQAPNGQIPKYVDVDHGTADFWYLGCIDATLWWLIALGEASRLAPAAARRRRLRKRATAALAWLACQEHQEIRLLQQNEASDWADIMPRSGFVLYTNALWYRVKREYAVPDAARTRAHFNGLFDPEHDAVPEYRRLRLLVHYARGRRRPDPLYLSYVNLGHCGREGDVFGNLLAIVFGLVDKARAARVLHAIGRGQRGASWPVRATLAPIRRDDPQWRAYMGRHAQNLEHQYHNGGIWPMIGGFWALALAGVGRPREAARVLSALARANAQRDWEFNEWFHGTTGEPRGMPRQSWNAATFLLAERALREPVLVLPRA